VTAKQRQYALWTVLVAALLGLTAAALWMGPSRRLGGGAVAPGAVQARAAERLDDFGVVPDFALVSQTGDSVHLRDLRGQVWIADFIFTNCASTCPMMTAQLSRLEKGLAGERGVRLVSFSVDPERDTPARLAEYAKSYGAQPERWMFLTGDKHAIRQLSIEGFRLAVADPSPEELARGAEAVLHSTRLVLVDGDAHIRGYYDGTDDAAVERLGEDVKRLAAAFATP
jgi:cytochrome oxidase Cu insertion factor (SCO1/SenC/PrrC family)